jgi:ribonucleoside-triphosphate reductase
VVISYKEAKMNKVRCPQCGSENCFGISRIVGYFSKISNWSPSKKEELKARQRGNYSVEENLKK